MFDNVFNGMFGKIGSGMCRLSMSGGIAVKTSGGYKSYNMKTGNLVNCDSFVFDIGDEFFFCIPTNKVAPGDIILINGKPKCVIESDKKTITVIDYEDSTVKTVLPERHVFMGETYFYGKIVSMFGSNIFNGKGNMMNKIMKYKVMSEMMKGNSGSSSGFGSMLPFMLMNNNGGNMFDGMFEGLFDTDTDTDTDTAEETVSEDAE